MPILQSNIYRENNIDRENETEKFMQSSVMSCF